MLRRCTLYLLGGICSLLAAAIAANADQDDNKHNTAHYTTNNGTEDVSSSAHTAIDWINSINCGSVCSGAEVCLGVIVGASVTAILSVWIRSGCIQWRSGCIYGTCDGGCGWSNCWWSAVVWVGVIVALGAWAILSWRVSQCCCCCRANECLWIVIRLRRGAVLGRGISSGGSWCSCRADESLWIIVGLSARAILGWSICSRSGLSISLGRFSANIKSSWDARSFLGSWSNREQRSNC